MDFLEGGKENLACLHLFGYIVSHEVPFLLVRGICAIAHESRDLFQCHFMFFQYWYSVMSHVCSGVFPLGEILKIVNGPCFHIILVKTYSV